MFFYRLFCTILALLSKILFNLKVYGRENVPQLGGFIIASNHKSYLDPICVGAASPRPLHFMAREDLLSIRAFGSLLRLVGVFAVKRDTADTGAIRVALKWLNKGEGVALFPEGARSSDGAIKSELKKGVGFLSYKSGCPVIPAYVKGSSKALPKNSRFIKFGQTIKVYLGKRIDCKGCNAPNEKEAYSKITDKVCDSLMELAKLYGI